MEVKHNNELVPALSKAEFARSLKLSPSAISMRMEELEKITIDNREMILDTEYNRQLFNTRKKWNRKEDLTGKMVEVHFIGKVTETKGKSIYVDMGAGLTMSFKRKDVVVKKDLN